MLILIIIILIIKINDIDKKIEELLTVDIIKACNMSEYSVRELIKESEKIKK